MAGEDRFPPHLSPFAKVITEVGSGANPAVRLRFGRWPGWLRNPKFDPID
jgi:hypothetical protein